MMMDFDDLKKLTQKCWNAQSSYRDAMKDDFHFYDGHQWTDEEIVDFTDTSRAPVIFNRVAPIIAAVQGSEINNRTQVRFIPREIGDAKPNEVLTAGAEWFRDEGDAEDEDSHSFTDMLICGIGWTETYLDFEADEEGAPRTQRIDPTEMFWDLHAHRKGLIDSGVMGRVREIPRREAKDMWPDVKVSDINAAWIDDRKDDPQVDYVIEGDDYTYPDTDTTSSSDTVTVVQIQYREKMRFVEYIEPSTGQRDEMPKSDWDRLAKGLPILPPHRVISRVVWKQAFLGNVLLSESQPCDTASTFQAITGHWDRKDKRFYGLLRSMRDPQKFANKTMMQTMRILDTNAKGGVVIEEDAVSDMRAFEESWAAADSVSFVKPGKIGGIQPKPGPQVSAGLMGLGDFAISAIRDVSGVNMELMGMREAQQAGVLEYQRRQSAMTTLAFYFDSLRYYRKRQGDVILWFLTKWIAPTGRLVRIVKDGLQEYVPLAIDDDTRKYDVIVDDSPQAPNEKERAWSVIQSMMPLLQNSGLSLEDWADILDYSPLPSSFADMVRTKAEEQKQQGQQPNPMEQLAIAKEQAEVEETNSKTQLNLAKIYEMGVPDQTLASRVDHPVEVAARAQQFESAARLNDAKVGEVVAKTEREDLRLLNDLMRTPRQ